MGQERQTVDGGTAHRAANPEGLDVPEVTLGGLLRAVAAEVPEQIALVDGRAGADGRWTYRSLLNEAETVARHLAASYEPGCRVALWSANRPEWVIVELAVALAGLVLVPVNPTYRRAEAEHVVASSRAVLLVHGRPHRDNDLPDLAGQIATRLGCTCTSLDGLMDVRRDRRSDELPEVRPDWPVQVQFTSGSTGPPKGALLHHQGLVAMPSMAVPLMELERPLVWLNVLPMFHIGGCGLSTIGPMVARGTQVLADRFTADGAIDLIEREGVTVMGSVPTMLVAMLERSGPMNALETLEVVMSGGAKVHPELIGAIEAGLGVRFVVAFGQTEAHGHIAQTRPGDSVRDKAETVGRPLPHVEVKVVGVGSGQVVGHGETGELYVRSPMLMREYVGRPERTAQAFDADGFLRTGDLVSLDQRGYLEVAGRVDDTISRGGENLAPEEIEAVLLEHRAVTAAAVIGIPDARLGQSVAACVRTSGPTPDEGELEAWVEARLAFAKVPRTWRFVDDLPVTATGKLQRFRLRALFEEPEAPTPKTVI